MKKLKKNYQNLKYNLIFFLFFFYQNHFFLMKFYLIIQGNDFTDTDVIISILKNIPENLDEEYSNDIIKVLNDSNLFSDVRVKLIDNKYIIIVKEYPNINKIYFKNNERLKDEELEFIASEIDFTKLNKSSINLFINEIKKIYESFGYNNVKIEYS